MPPPFDHPILLVEDNLNDVLFIRRAIQRGGLPFALHHVCNGEEAISYLRGEAQYGDRDRYPLPSLIISNIKMPRVNGLQLLQWIRQQSKWKTLPVVVLSSAGDPGEVGQFEQLGVSSYFIKPAKLDELVAALEAMKTLLPPLT